MHCNAADIEAYRDFCRRVEVPLFAQDYWLDAVCPGKWGAFIVRRDGNVVAAMPFYAVSKMGRRFLLQPLLTQCLGPQIDFTQSLGSDYERRLFYRECVNDILAQIGHCNFAYQQIPLHYSITDWLPFYWKGYRSELKYTYRIPDITDTDKVLSEFSSSRRRDLKSAISHGVKIDMGLALEEFYSFHKECVAQKGESLSYPFDMLRRIYSSLSDRGQCAIVAARDKDGNLLAAYFIVWDKKTAYLLMTAVPRNRKLGGATVCIVEAALRLCSDKVKAFDFEGSMIDGVEQSYARYATVQQPYIYLEKFSSLFMEMFLRFSGKVK